MRDFVSIARADLRNGVGWSALGFFLATSVIMTFAVGPNLPQLAQLAPAIVWSMALLALLIGLEATFRLDAADGTLDLYAVRGMPSSGIVLAKAASRWLRDALPLVVASAPVAMMLNRTVEDALWIAFTLLIGLPGLSLIGTMGAALTLGARGAAVLLPLIVLPLSVPVVIFAVSGEGGLRTAVALLLAFDLLALVIAPIAGGAALDAARNYD